MFGAFLATILSLQARQHLEHKCCCNQVVVTSYTAIVEGPDDAWGGSMPRVRYVPNRTEFKRCPHAERFQIR